LGLQIGYGFLSGFSGVSMFDSLCVAAYNAVLFVPVVFFFLDKDIDEETIMAHPEAYSTCRLSRLMNLRTFAVWFVRAFIQVRLPSVLLVYLPFVLTAACAELHCVVDRVEHCAGCCNGAV
jgi:hypothetical protein